MGQPVEKEKRNYFSHRSTANQLASLAVGVEMNTRQVGFALGLKRKGSLYGLRTLLYVAVSSGWFTLEKRSNRNYVWTRVGKFTGEQLWAAYLSGLSKSPSWRAEPVQLDPPSEATPPPTMVESVTIDTVTSFTQMRQSLRAFEEEAADYAVRLAKFRVEVDRLLG